MAAPRDTLRPQLTQYITKGQPELLGATFLISFFGVLRVVVVGAAEDTASYKIPPGEASFKFTPMKCILIAANVIIESMNSLFFFLEPNEQ